ncbi:DUF6473 family protein [Jannaschia sp. W003]|uniref:DUF6473 family protein n=1 Tax=Jannaschia sp. W003 TaxID=2867012 RepID=UPI0021A74F6E|nr:DUF6473 family protein [Jannaschia sp. W003]UWQ21261.1 DUF6473 family protein [Jannaschia sp. W003]
MTFHARRIDGDALPWSLPGGKLAFRGPAVDPEGPFVAVLGASEVAGRHVAEPFTHSLSHALAMPVANLGVQNGGADVILREREGILAMAARAEVTVLQTLGLHNLTNRFYRVHPRRNDRFLRPSKLMRETFGRADFSDFVFTRHMTAALRGHGAFPYAQLVAELQAAWVARMQEIVIRIPNRIVLLHIEGTRGAAQGDDPLRVTDAMIEAVMRGCDAEVRCDVREMYDDVHLEEMQFAPEERESARHALPPVAHDLVAERLVRAVGPLLRGCPAPARSARRHDA